MKNEKYTEDEFNTLNEINKTLNILSLQYNSDKTKTGMKSNKDGSFEVFIDNGPTFWFKDEFELGGWILNINNGVSE